MDVRVATLFDYTHEEAKANFSESLAALGEKLGIDSDAVFGASPLSGNARRYALSLGIRSHKTLTSFGLAAIYALRTPLMPLRVSRATHPLVTNSAHGPV